MSEKERKQAVGVCNVVSERGDWTTFEIEVPGNQYPLKLSTKLGALIDAARSAKGHTATWTYTEADGSVNPNTGKPYKNRYLEAVDLSANGASDEPPHEPHHAPVIGGDKDRAITRMACLKASSLLMQNAAGDIEFTIVKTIEIAGRFEHWIYRDIDPVPFE